MTERLKTRKRCDVASKDLNIFEWNIVNFSKAFKNTKEDEILTSPVFVGKSTGLPNSFWRIEVIPKEKDVKAEHHLSVHLALSKELNQNNPVVNAWYEISLLDKRQQVVFNGKDMDDSKSGTEFGGDLNVWGFRITTHSQLFNSSNHYLDEDIIAASTKQKQNHLNKDFSKLLTVASKFSDLDIVVGDITLKAYKGILSYRSPVFEAMFQNDMSESRTSTIQIEDFTSKTVKRMLEFIYSGNLEIGDEDVIELLKISEKYQLAELKAACTKTAILKIFAENAVELLIIGDMYNAPELKYKAMTFINSNKANPMFSAENENGAFEKLVKKYPMLLLEMYQSVRKNDVDVHYTGESNESIEEVTKIITNFKIGP